MIIFFFLLFTSFYRILIFVFKGPSLDGHVEFFEELSEVLLIDAVVPAGKSESFQSAALYPFEHRAFADLAVCGDIS